jgi:hypothetical protein
MRSVARGFGVGLHTVQRWVERAGDLPLDLVDWSDRPDAPAAVANRTPIDIEEEILSLRHKLQKESDLGEYGAEAIHSELLEQGCTDVPCVRTINRILERRGVFDGRRRVRHDSPPIGWYLPKVAKGLAELDQFDVTSGFVIEGGTEVETLNGISLHGALVCSWPRTAINAKFAVQALTEHWRAFGCPAYAQFDNDTRFQGPHQHKDVISRVMRLCLSLGITPVFAPPRELGFQAAVESLNNRWQQKVWERFRHDSLESLKERSRRYIVAARAKSALRQEGAPERRLIPEDWKLSLQAPPRGMVVFLRRTDGSGQVHMLGHVIKVREQWVHRLVRAEVDLNDGSIKFYSLRRREPGQQDLLITVPYQLPNRVFRE